MGCDTPCLSEPRRWWRCCAGVHANKVPWEPTSSTTTATGKGDERRKLKGWPAQLKETRKEKKTNKGMRFSTIEEGTYYQMTNDKWCRRWEDPPASPCGRTAGWWCCCCCRCYCWEITKANEKVAMHLQTDDSFWTANEEKTERNKRKKNASIKSKSRSAQPLAAAFRHWGGAVA